MCVRSSLALCTPDRDVTPVVSGENTVTPVVSGENTESTPGGHDDKVEEERGSSESADEKGSKDSGDDSFPTPRASVDMTNMPLHYTPSVTTPLRRIPRPEPTTSNSSRSESQTQSTLSGGSGSTSRLGHVHKPGSPLLSMHRRLRSEAKLSDYSYTKDTAFLYKDLTKALGNTGKAFMLERNFWNVLFMSVVTVERSYLGWNENTTELYQRLDS